MTNPSISRSSGMSDSYPPRTEQNCDNCFYNTELYRLNDDGQVEMRLQCRRYAPKPTEGPWVSSNPGAFWPSVKAHEWCGEWAPKEESA